MYSHLNKNEENKHKSISSDSVQKQGENDYTDFVDNSPEAKQAAQLQAMADNSPEAKQAAQLQAMADNSPEAKEAARLQTIADKNSEAEQPIAPNKPNNTGLPDDLKRGIENLSGYSMDDVKVHYNSDKPAQLGAHAYAQGTDIYLASGQEKHLPHEAWHVVQQMQGRVKPTVTTENGVGVNDGGGLEKEADVMGLKMWQSAGESNSEKTINTKSTISRKTVQLKRIIEHDKLNVIGEDHGQSDDRRDSEKLISKIYTKSGDYYEEQDFNIKTNEKESPKHGDLPYTRILIAARILHDTLSITPIPTKEELPDIIAPFNYEVNNAKAGVDTSALPDFEKTLGSKINASLNEIQKITETIGDNFSIENLTEKTKKLYESETELNDNSIITDFKHKERSTHMHKHANEFHNKSGIWKIGEKHIQDLDSQPDENTLYNKVSMGDFNSLVNQLPAEALKNEEFLKENQDAITKDFLNGWWKTIDKKFITYNLLKKATNLTDKNTLAEDIKKVFPVENHGNIDNFIQFIATKYVELEDKLKNDENITKETKELPSYYLNKGYIKYGVGLFTETKGRKLIEKEVVSVENKIKNYFKSEDELLKENQEAVMKKFLNGWWETIDKKFITSDLLKKATNLTDKNTLAEDIKKVFPDELYENSPVTTHDNINDLIQFITVKYIELEDKLKNDENITKETKELSPYYLNKGYVKFGITNYFDTIKGQDKIKAEIAPIEEKIKAHINRMIGISSKIEEKENIPE